MEQAPRDVVEAESFNLFKSKLKSNVFIWKHDSFYHLF